MSITTEHHPRFDDVTINKDSPVPLPSHSLLHFYSQEVFSFLSLFFQLPHHHHTTYNLTIIAPSPGTPAVDSSLLTSCGRLPFQGLFPISRTL